VKQARAKGDGSIIERTRAGKTYHVARITFVERGVRKYRERWCKTPADARHALRLLRADHTRDELPSADRTPLAGYLTGWLAATRASVAPPTYLRYHSLIETHLAPACGALRIATLEPEDVLALYDRLRDRGASDSTVDKAHKLLHAAVGDAVPALLRFNPVAMIPRRLRPKYAAPETDSYDVDEIRAFMSAAAGDEFFALYVLALTSQLRQGEIFALTFGDFDAKLGAVFVRASVQDQYQEAGGAIARTKTGATLKTKVAIAGTKTRAGRRRIDLPPIAVAALADQAERMMARKKNGSKLFFPSEVGTVLSRQNFLRRHLYPLMDEAGLRRITFHALRHSGASALASKVPLEVLQQRLGHANAKTTSGVYSHLSPSLQGLAATVLADLFPPDGGERGEEAS